VGEGAVEVERGHEVCGLGDGERDEERDDDGHLEHGVLP
jgi:hypothetical protein